MKNIEIERHPWPPYLPEGTKLLIMGTFPPQPKRWSMDFFYPNVINDFWRMIGLIFFGNKDALYDTSAKKFKLDEIKALLNNLGIGLGDTGLEVRRLAGNASDKFLEIVTSIPLWETLAKIPECHDIASTGEKAAAVLAEITGTKIPKVGSYASSVRADDGSELRIWRMPSTSRAYPLALEKKAEYYSQMFKYVGIKMMLHNSTD